MTNGVFSKVCTGFGAITLAVLVACAGGAGGFSLGPSGLQASATATASVPPIPSSLLNPGFASGSSASSDAASQKLPAAARLSVVGYRVAKNFHTDGTIQIAFLPLDAQGKAILDTNVYVSFEAKCSVPFPIEGSVRVGPARQPAARLPFQLAVDIDSSGSMGSSDKERLRVKAAGQFIDLVARDYAKSEFAVFEFESKVTLLQDFTPDTAVAKAAVARVKEKGATALHLSAVQALDLLAKQKKPGFQQALLVLTDGGDNSSKGTTAADVISKAKQNGVPIYAVSLGGAVDIPGLGFVSDLQDYAAQTGGLFAYAKGADQLLRTFESMATVASKGNQVAEVKLKGLGGVFIPFSTMTLTIKVRSGGKELSDTLEFIVPMK